MSEPLTDILRPARPTAIVDIGANPIDGEPPYKRMLNAGLCDLVGFEPQQDALAKLTRMKGPRERYLPYAIGDGTERTLHICTSEGMSSLLVPDAAHLALFNSFPIWGEVTAKLPIATKRLDDVAEIAAMDFLKMDIQGSELDVIRHGREKLKQAVCLQVEVSFVPLYEGQCGFGEIDVELRQMGFMPHCFQAVKMWPIATSAAAVDDNPPRPLRQLLEADLVYVRDFTHRGNMDAEQWKQLALIAHHVYGSVDLTARAIAMTAALGAAPQDAVARYFSYFPKRPN